MNKSTSMVSVSFRFGKGSLSIFFEITHFLLLFFS